MIDTQAIRSKILDLAMRGKLTEQLPEDGTAEELYRQIQAEKHALIKAGKIKKEKLLPEIADGEVPFEIPANWKWIRLNELGVFCGGKTPSMANNAFWKNGSINWVTSKDMKQKYITASEMMITEKAARELNLLPAQTVLFVVRSGILRRRFPVAILSKEGTINQDLKALKLFVPGMCEFVYCLLKGFESTILFKYTKDGTTVNNIVFDDLLTMPVPLPPLAEQHRIVARIEQTFSALDTIDTLQAKDADNLAVLKSKLIDAAIQGKLTEQLPEDGTAEELYRRIQAEKQALIKAGKIKKEKPPPEITADEIPFDIPKSWKWVRFSDLYSLSNGVASRGTPGGIFRPVLRLADLASGQIDTNGIRQITLSDDEFSSHKVLTGDLVFIRVNGSRDKVANAFLYSGDTAISYCDHLFCGHRTSNSFDASYIMTVYHSAMAKAQIDPEIKTTAGQNTISQKSMGKVLIPLPPLAEQTRIVAKLEELLSLCERVG